MSNQFGLNFEQISPGSVRMLLHDSLHLTALHRFTSQQPIVCIVISFGPSLLKNRSIFEQLNLLATSQQFCIHHVSVYLQMQFFSGNLFTGVMPSVTS
jgi:hypothetical protein